MLNKLEGLKSQMEEHLGKCLGLKMMKRDVCVVTDKAAFILEPCTHTYSPLFRPFNVALCAKCMTSCINPLGSCNCIVCGRSSVTCIRHIPSTPRPYPDVYLTPQSLPRLGTQFTPGIGETTSHGREGNNSLSRSQ